MDITEFKVLDKKITFWANQSKASILEFTHSLRTPNFNIPSRRLDFEFELRILPDKCKVNIKGCCTLHSDNMKELINAIKGQNKPVMEFIQRSVSVKCYGISRVLLRKENVNINFPKVVDILNTNLKFKKE